MNKKKLTSECICCDSLNGSLDETKEEIVSPYPYASLSEEIKLNQ